MVLWSSGSVVPHGLAMMAVEAGKTILIDQADTVSRCESIAFNPWHALPAHRPLGNMNRARREIYQAMAAFRGRRAGAATR